MKVLDKVKVMGRGYILVVIPKDIIQMTDEIVFNNIHFEIKGIERLSFIKKIGLLLSPNNMVGELINIGDEINIIKHND